MKSTERKRGDKWADIMRGIGAWVVKLPSSSLAGLPDWLMVQQRSGICLVEAKVLQEFGSAFVPSQCTRAQRFFLEVVARHGGRSYVLVLGPRSWHMERVRLEVMPIPREVFDSYSMPYPEGWTDE